ncbi:outer membrane protein transport protein [Cellulophaga baltica]|uniref:OmpP1/FadL family transporter n=1 Tax=Cellulophaga TaxID=104264 RepID=UPI001C06F276|nr:MULTISPECIES: outer membrane protein transport protein [Cellulophaga]MBU2997282.1 outer membrane protein transport protein [Cellulophaga baltica]MDO6768680.1 outer membrane protein transport protein [Cellulophaga sp. 1_MG-2023]
MTKTKIKYLGLALGLFFCSFNGFAQSEALTSSPYSLYGLGVINQTSIGKSNSLGYTGIGISSNSEINNLNPANFGSIPQNSFFYDIGMNAEINKYSNSTSDDTNTTVNFSNLAFAFRIAEGLGAGISMVPYSDVGYSVLSEESNIEGSTDTYLSYVTGIGSLSDLKLNLGYNVMDQLRVGLSTSFLFGSIDQEELIAISSSTFELTETTNYTGVRFGLGLQFDPTENITFGSIMNLPTTLKGDMTRSAVKTVSGFEITVEDEVETDADNFSLPLEVGMGVSAKLKDKYTVSLDYRKNYWSSTDQEDEAGTYVDQDIVGFGLEYIKNKKSYKYKDRINYRLGFNYDNGYLEINEQKIDGYSITTGLGLPLSLRSNSIINLSYSYSSKGRVETVLVKENYHVITLNMSLEDLWFRKRKIN